MIRKVVRAILPHLPTPLMRLYRRLNWERLFSHEPLPFRSIFIETMAGCNRTCSYCAVSYQPKRNGRLSDEIYSSLLRQLSDLNYDGGIHFYWINEPLLDKRIFDFIKAARQSLPKARVVFSSNGDIIDAEKIDRLINYCGVDNLALSMHDADALIRIKGIYDQLPESLQQKITIHTGLLGDGVNSPNIHNWGGAVNKKLDGYNFKTKPAWGCDALNAVVDYEGKMRGCCSDVMGDYIIGDLNVDTLLEIGKRAKPLFRGHFIGKYTTPTCLRCISGSP